MTRRRSVWVYCGAVFLLVTMSSLSVGVAFLSSPIPSIGGRGKARAAVVMEPLRPASPPTHTYAASGPEGEGRPREVEAETEVEETASSSSRKKGSSESGKAKHFDFLKEVAKNKKQAKANKQRFRDQRDEYLEDMRKAFKLMQIKEREESGFKWVKRPKRERQIPLKELKLGERYEATVITVKEHGAYVDFGAKKDGFVRLRDFSDTDFILDAREAIQPGDIVDFYVKYVSPEEGIVTGSFVPAEIESPEELEARTPLAEVREEDELWGEVTKVSNYGAFVDVGVEVQGFLHIIYYPKRYAGALTQDVFRPGMRLRVWAMEVDTEKRRLKLTAERPRSLPRVDYSWFMGGYEIEGVGPSAAYAGGDSYASYEDGRGLQPRGRGRSAEALERMSTWKLDDGNNPRGSRSDTEVVFDLDAKKAEENAAAAAAAAEEE